MNKKMTPEENAANMQNANKGTSGMNKQYKQMLDLRSRQLNTKQSTKKKG